MVQSRAGPKFPQQKHSSIPMLASTQLKPQSKSGIRYQQRIKAAYVCWYIPQTHWTKRRDWLRMHNSWSPSSLYFNPCLLTSWLLLEVVLSRTQRPALTSCYPAYHHGKARSYAGHIYKTVQNAYHGHQKYDPQKSRTPPPKSYVFMHIPCKEDGNFSWCLKPGLTP